LSFINFHQRLDTLNLLYAIWKEKSSLEYQNQKIPKLQDNVSHFESEEQFPNSHLIKLPFPFLDLVAKDFL